MGDSREEFGRPGRLTAHPMAMPLLPDPRSWNNTESNDPLLRWTLASLAGDRDARSRLMNELRACVAAQDMEVRITEALRSSPSHAAYRHLWESVCATVDLAPTGDDAVVARPFAIPIVLVVGAKGRLTIPGIIPDIDAVAALLERHGAVGQTRNFGLSNAMSSQDFLDRLRPSEIYRWSAGLIDGAALREVEAKEITVVPGREQVHLRFLIGAGVTPRAAASFLETAANIGAWGIALTRQLAQQLAQQGLDMLPLPRPPAAILKAAHNGRCAALETAFSLFVSNTVRRFRTTVGDPVAIVSSHLSEKDGAEVRISFSSALDGALLEGFRWPLHAIDDFDRTSGGVIDLLHECRIVDVHVIPRVLSEFVSEEHRMFLTAADLRGLETH